MVRSLALILIFISNLSYANVNLEFQGVTISELSQLVVKGIIKRDFVISPEVLSDNRKVSISLKNQTEKEVLPFFRGFLSDNDIDLIDKGSFLYLAKKLKKNDALETFAPKYDNQIETSPPDNKPCFGCKVLAKLTGETVPQDAVLPALPTTSYIYKPKHKSAVELSQLISFLGAEVSPVATSDLLIYKTDIDKHAIIEAMLNDLDKSTNDLMVKVYLYEVTKSAREGSAFNAALNLLKGKLGVTLQTGANLANTVTLNLPNVDAVFSAFATDNRFNVVSSPSLRVKHNKLSRFSVGSEVPVLGSVTQNQNQAPTQSINYKQSGVILEITPQILATDIELQINQQLSNFVPTTNGVNNSPTLIKRELNTTITTKDGDLIFMGGLDETKSNAQSTGLSWLPKLFNAKSLEDDKTDILLVLHVQRI